MIPLEGPDLTGIPKWQRVLSIVAALVVAGGLVLWMRACASAIHIGLHPRG